MKKLIIGVAAVVLLGGAVFMNLDKDARRMLANLPTDTDVLFWSIPQRDAAFRAMDWMPILAKLAKPQRA